MDNCRNMLSLIFGTFINSSSSISPCSNTVSYQDNTIFDIFIDVDISSMYISAPILSLNPVTSSLRSIRINDSCSVEKVSIGLYQTGTPTTCRGSKSVLTKLWANNSRALKQFRDVKGNLYYGNKGLILDKDYNILLICVLEGTKSQDGEACFKNMKVFIHPRVISGKGIVEKGIRDILIPIFSSHKFQVSVPHLLYSGRDGAYPEIILKNVTDKYVVKPAKIDLATFSNEGINKALTNHITDIVSILS